MSLVDDFSQFFAVYNFFINVHGNFVVNMGMSLSIETDDFCNCRTPERKLCINQNSNLSFLDDLYFYTKKNTKII